MPSYRPADGELLVGGAPLFKIEITFMIWSITLKGYVYKTLYIEFHYFVSILVACD